MTGESGFDCDDHHGGLWRGMREAGSKQNLSRLGRSALSFAAASPSVRIQLEDAEQAGEVAFATEVAAHRGLEEKQSRKVRGLQTLAGKPG
jgi:hypothetical protein